MGLSWQTVTCSWSLPLSKTTCVKLFHRKTIMGDHNILSNLLTSCDKSAGWHLYINFITKQHSIPWLHFLRRAGIEYNYYMEVDSKGTQIHTSRECRFFESNRFIPAYPTDIQQTHGSGKMTLQLILSLQFPIRLDAVSWVAILLCLHRDQCRLLLWTQHCSRFAMHRLLSVARRQG